MGTLFSGVGALSGNIAAVNGALAEPAEGLAGVISNMSMLTIALIGFALSLIYYKNNQRPVAAAAVEEDDDDEL